MRRIYSKILHKNPAEAIPRHIEREELSPAYSLGKKNQERADK
jgi:hypothetical protein